MTNLLLAPLLAAALSTACSSSFTPTDVSSGASEDQCGALSSYVTRCPGNRSACTAANLAQCDGNIFIMPGKSPIRVLPSFASQTAGSALASCVAAAPCAPDPLDEDGVALCFIDKLEALTPTAAQQKVATDFCASCNEPGTMSCSASFFADIKVAGGFDVLTVSDEVAREIDATCFGAPAADAGSCQHAFSTCLSGVIVKHVAPPPPQCGAGG
jgi:hypothetical protein